MRHAEFKTIGIISNRKIKGCKDILDNLLTYLEEKNYTVLIDEHANSVVKQEKIHTNEDIGLLSDIIITLGGDGTVLKAARIIPSNKNTPILPVNLGNLGFLTEVAPEKLIQSLDAILIKKKYTLDKRDGLRINLYRNKQKIFSNIALNDAVINQGSFARLIYLKTEINQRQINRIRADGLIIATPTGSTGHSLSAQGPIVHPEINGIIITPICPAGLGNRSVVIPNDRQIKITIESQLRDESALSAVGLTLDGQVVVPLKYGDEIKIRKSNRNFYIIRLNGKRYFKMLRDKLGWGK